MDDIYIYGIYCPTTIYIYTYIYMDGMSQYNPIHYFFMVSSDCWLHPPFLCDAGRKGGWFARVPSGRLRPEIISVWSMILLTKLLKMAIYTGFSHEKMLFSTVSFPSITFIPLLNGVYCKPMIEYP